MNYADLTATQRDTLLTVVALNEHTEATINEVHAAYEERFGPVSQHNLSATVLPALAESSLTVKERSETDGRVWVYRPTPAGHEAVHQALRERARWIRPPEPRPDHDAQLTLPEVVTR